MEEAPALELLAAKSYYSRVSGSADEERRAGR
jgi:hypothetical protein